MGGKTVVKLLKFLIVLFALFILWVFTAPFLAGLLIVAKPLERADAILVLSGSQVYLERTHKAAELYKSGVSNKIFLTDDGELGGWSSLEQRNPKFVDNAKSELIFKGVPAEHIEILNGEVSGTIYEAQVLAESAEKRNLKAVLLVTSAYHTRRVISTFEQIIEEKNVRLNLGIVSAETGIQTPAPETWWLSPKGWQMVGGEYLKLLGYWMFY